MTYRRCISAVRLEFGSNFDPNTAKLGPKPNTLAQTKCAHSPVFRLQLCGRPYISERRGGLNGSTQHLLKAFLHEPGRLISCAELNSSETEALFRF